MINLLRTSAIILVSALSLAACQQEASSAGSKERLTVSTPSQRKITISCPGASGAERALCQQARVLVGRSFPSGRKRCLGQYYSLSGRLAASRRGQQVGFSWDCNTMVPLNKLRRAVEGLSKRRLGAAAGVSDYRHGLSG